MKKILLGLFVTCALSPTTLFGKTVDLPPGSFEVPDNLQILDHKEDISPDTGKAQGIIVFGPRDDLPRAVFIVTYAAATNATPPTDMLDAAVKIGNPFNPSLTGKDAHQINFGGAQAGTYSGTLPNGLAARSYVVANNGYRLTVLLKGPNRSPYKELMEAFASGLEQFRWAALQAPATPAPSTVNDKASAQTRDFASPPTRSDQSTLLELLGGDTPLSPDRLQRYLSIALSHPPGRAGFFQAGQRPDDWGTSVSRLVFSDKDKFKSLEFWTSIRGGDYLKDVLKRNGAVIDRIPGSTVVSGEPKKEQVPAITSEVVAWYSAKLRERGQ